MTPYTTKFYHHVADEAMMELQAAFNGNQNNDEIVHAIFAIQRVTMILNHDNMRKGIPGIPGIPEEEYDKWL